LNLGIKQHPRAVKLIMEVAVKASQELFFGGSGTLVLSAAYADLTKQGINKSTVFALSRRLFSFCSA